MMVKYVLHEYNSLDVSQCVNLKNVRLSKHVQNVKGMTTMSTEYVWCFISSTWTEISTAVLRNATGGNFCTRILYYS